MMRVKFLILFSLIVSFFTVLNSCAYQTHVNKKLATVKKSFVKIETFLVEESCVEASCPTEAEPILFSSASGAVIIYDNKKHILTAAHVCNSNNFIFGPKEVEGYDLKFVIIDRDNRKYEGKIIKINFGIDTCIMYSENINSPPLPISSKKPEYGERIYNIASPLGISYKGMVIVTDGFFSGNVGFKAYYAIPTAQGASGSPIINSNGELIGMIHSVHSRFHHVAISPVFSELWNFLSSAPNHTSQSLSLSL